MSLSLLSAWIDEISDAPEAAPEPVSGCTGLRRLSGRIFASCAATVFLAWLVF